MMIIITALLISALHEVALGRPQGTADAEDAPTSVFWSYDGDDDNKVSAEEIRDFIEDKYGHKYDMMMATSSMAKFDVDEDGFLKEDEFQSWYDNEYELLFNSYDANSDEKISVEEIKAFLAGDNDNKKSENSIRETVFSMAAFDEDSDGMINEEEFRLYFNTYDPHNLAYQEAMFRVMDRDGDKSIQSGEYRNTLKLWGYTDEVIKRRTVEHIKEFDENKDEEWDFEEFRLWDDSPSSEVELQEDFTSKDKDGNDIISEEELKMYFISIGAEELAKLDHIEDEDDSNGDGGLSFPEFSATWTLRG